MGKQQVSKTSSSSLKPVVPIEEAIRRIEEQIEIGLDIRDQQIFSEMDLGEAQRRREEWLETNIEMVTRLFNNPSFAEEYKRDISLVMDSAITFGLMEKNFKEDINEQIWKLRSFLKRLRLTPEDKAEELIKQSLVEDRMSQEQPKEIRPKKVQPKEVQPKEVQPIEFTAIEVEPIEEPPIERPPVEKLPKKEPSKEPSSKEKAQEGELLKEVHDRIKPLREEPVSPVVSKQSKVIKGNILLVHGRDETIKKPVLEFVEKLELKASIIHEQPDGRMGIIEKLEEFSNINFAIFLFTPDDFAIPRDNPREKQTPVNQNVIFEFGYLVGKLGFGKVCTLYKEGLKIPWDYPGVVSIPMDFRGGWRFLVAKEIKQAGIEIDLNKVI